MLPQAAGAAALSEFGCHCQVLPAAVAAVAEGDLTAAARVTPHRVRVPLPGGPPLMAFAARGSDNRQAASWLVPATVVGPAQAPRSSCGRARLKTL
jgi:hypothetical protein